MALKFNPSIKIEDYELLDSRHTRLKTYKKNNNRHGFYWSLQEDFMLTERWFSLNKDIHAIAVLHKRSFKSICFRLEINKLVKEKFDRTWIDLNNQRYLKQK